MWKIDEETFQSNTPIRADVKPRGLRLPFPLSNQLWIMKPYFARLNCWSTCEIFSWYPRNAHSTEKERVGEEVGGREFNKQTKIPGIILKYNKYYA